MSKPNVLILAESCNPVTPSLPVVGYKYAKALSSVANIRVATHVRNRPEIDRGDRSFAEKVTYIDNEHIAAPFYRLGEWLRGGNEVAWSTSQIMAYLPYIEFERQALKAFRKQLNGGDIQIVHRITPMSPALPSFVSGRTRQPFLIGPLNGNLDWPPEYKAEQARERERIRVLRSLYRYMPFSRGTYRSATAILASFEHTQRDIDPKYASKVVSVPEIGFDPQLFHANGRIAPLSGPGPTRFLYVGRMVPYKVPEVVVRAFCTSEKLRSSVLHLIGDGPDLPLLQKVVAETGAEDRVIFEGKKTQAEVAQAMRQADVFVFPSVRELGAGVVIEAMASGLVCIVTGYGAPGSLVGNTRGVSIPLASRDALTVANRDAMEHVLDAPDHHKKLADAGKRYALEYFTWDAKASFTSKVYETVLAGDAISGISSQYDP